MAGGAFVHVPAGVALEQPSCSPRAGRRGQRADWRALVVLEDGAQAEVWEQYASAAPGLLNTVVELVVGENANLRFVCGAGPLAREAGSSAPSAPRSRTTARSTGSRSASAAARGKVFEETKLAGRGADGKVTGAYALDGRQHLDFDTTQEHAAPH